MKKAVFQKYGDVDTLKIIKADLPKCSKGELLVKVHAVALNPKDILIRKGKFKRLTGNKFPQGIGFDFSGIVEASDKDDYRKGDKVFGSLNGMRGRCCAEYLNIKVEELYKMPTKITFEQAAGLPLAGQTSLQAIRNLGRIKKGEKILINGASGGVGTLAIQIAKYFGAEVTTVSSSKNLEFCKSLGADYTISYEDTNILMIKEVYNVFYDVFGNFNYSAISHLLAPKGKYITTVPSATIFREMLLNFTRKKKAKLVIVKSNSKDLSWFFDGVNQNIIQPIVDKVFDFDEIKLAQAYIETKRAKGKVILTIKSSDD